MATVGVKQLKHREQLDLVAVETAIIPVETAVGSQSLIVLKEAPTWTH